MVETVDPGRTRGSVPALLGLVLGGVVDGGDGGPRMWIRRLHETYGSDFSRGHVRGADAVVFVEFEAGACDGDFIQLRVPALPGCYRVDALRVGSTHIEDLARRVMAVEGERLDCEARDAVRMRSATGVPAVEIDLRGILRAGATVSVAIRREPWGAEAERLMTARFDSLTSELRLQAADLGLITAKLGEAARDTRIECVSSAVSGLVEAVAAAGDAESRQFAELRGGLAALEAVIAGNAAETASRLAAELEARQAEVLALRAEVGLLRADLGELRIQLDRQAAEAASREDVRQVHAGVERIAAAIEEGVVRRFLRRLRGPER